MIDNRILEAEQELYQARLLAEKHQYSVSVNKSYRAVLAAAKALLVTEGIDPATDAETLSEFERRLTEKGFVPASYHNLGAQIGDLGPKDTSPEFAHAKIGFARGFVEVCKAATEQMGKDLKLSQAGKTEGAGKLPVTPAGATVGETAGAAVFDLRGVMCPLNYVKTKLKLEMICEPHIKVTSVHHSSLIEGTNLHDLM